MCTPRRVVLNKPRALCNILFVVELCQLDDVFTLCTAKNESDIKQKRKRNIKIMLGDIQLKQSELEPKC